MIDLAKVIAEQYEKKGFKIDPDEFKGRIPGKKDLDAIRRAFKPFTSNRFKTKWFDNLNKWFDFDLDFDFDFEKLSKQWQNKDYDCNGKSTSKTKNISLKK